MTAEHDDSPENSPENNSGFDALMAALTDEPLPEDADTALRAEHREATADLALLREQLGLIGDALAAPPPDAEPIRVRRPARVRRWAPKVAFGTLVAAGVAAVVTGMGWLIATGGADVTSDSGSSAGKADSEGSDQDSSGSRFGSPYYLACTRLVAEGTVASVERLSDGVQLRVTVNITHYYKQDADNRPDQLTYVIDDTFADGLKKGDPVLFGIPKGDAVPDHWVVGKQEVARERAWIQASLAESRKIDC